VPQARSIDRTERPSRDRAAGAAEGDRADRAVVRQRAVRGQEGEGLCYEYPMQVSVSDALTDGEAVESGSGEKIRGDRGLTFCSGVHTNH